MKHLMLDIETLDTATSAVVIQVGWVTFDLVGPISSPVQWTMDIQEQINQGRTISASTLKFWMEQSDIARQQVFDPSVSYNVQQLREWLRMMLYGTPIKHVWAHGPAFDIATLKSLLGEEPWDFRSLRDTRTLAMLAPHIERPAAAVKHNAGDDALAQAKWVQLIMAELKNNTDETYMSHWEGL